MHDPVNALTRISQVWPRVKGTLWVRMYMFPCSQLLSIGCIRITKCEKFTADHCCERTSSQGHMMYCLVRSYTELGDPFQDILISLVTCVTGTPVTSLHP